MKPYKQKPGEFEIRILPDGKVLIPAPDESLLELSRILNQSKTKATSARKARKDERANVRRAKQRGRQGHE